MTDALQAAAYEVRRRKAKREPVDAPYYITDDDAREIARQSSALSISANKTPDEQATYEAIASGKGTLYDMRLVVRRTCCALN